MRHHFIKLSSSSLLIILMIALSASWVNAQDGGRGDKGDPQPGNRLFSDDFATFVNRWETAETSAYRIAYESQALHVELLEPETEVLTQPSNPTVIENFLMSARVEFVPDSSSDALAGLAFGYQNADNYYVFGIHPTGHYEVRLKQNGEWLTNPLVRGYYPDLATDAEAIINLTILYDEGYFELSINDTKLVPFYDEQLTSGEFGLYALAPTEAAHIIFDDFSVFDLVYTNDTDDSADDAEDATPPAIDDDTDTNTDDSASDNENNDDTPSEDVELVKPPRI